MLLTKINELLRKAECRLSTRVYKASRLDCLTQLPTPFITVCVELKPPSIH